MPPVAICAFNFAAFGRPVAGARIFALGEPSTTLAVTDSAGRAMIYRAAGQELTLVIEKPGFVTVQCGTLDVPPEGLQGRQHEVTFQTMPAWFFVAARRWLQRLPPSGRILLTTVATEGKTLYDAVQGEPGAVVRVIRDGRAIDAMPVYLGILPVIHKTDLITARWRRRAATSADGGVVIGGLEVGTYTVEAHAAGRCFRVAKAVIRADSPEVVNLSPPWCPRVLPADPMGHR